MLDPQRDVLVVRLEHAPDEARRPTFRRHDHQRSMLLDASVRPPGHHEIGEADEVVAVDVGEEHRGQVVRRGAGLHQPHHRRAPGVELERDVAAAHERPGAGASRPRVGNARAREDHFGGHAVASDRECREQAARVGGERGQEGPRRLTDLAHRTEEHLHHRRRRERVVTAVVQVIGGGERQQSIELAGEREPRKVVVQSGEIGEDVGRRVEIGEDHRERGDAVGDHRQGRARVRNDDLDVRVPGDRATEHQVDDRAGGVEEELEHRSWAAERRVLPADRRGGVQEDPRPAPVELVEHRLERRITEVGAVQVGEQHHAVDAQLVVGVRDLVECAGDVGQRQRRQHAEPPGVGISRPPTVLVDLAGERSGRAVIAEVHARRGDRQHADGDPETIHQLDVRVRRPLRQRGHSVRLRVPGGDGGLAVGRRQVVRMDVEQ